MCKYIRFCFTLCKKWTSQESHNKSIRDFLHRHFVIDFFFKTVTIVLYVKKKMQHSVLLPDFFIDLLYSGSTCTSDKFCIENNSREQYCLTLLCFLFPSLISISHDRTEKEHSSTLCMLPRYYVTLVFLLSLQIWMNRTLTFILYCICCVYFVFSVM